MDHVTKGMLIVHNAEYALCHSPSQGVTFLCDVPTHCLELRQPQPLVEQRAPLIFFSVVVGHTASRFHRKSCISLLTDWCWSRMTILSRLNYMWVWNNRKQHLEIQPSLLKCSREIRNLFQGPKSLDTGWFKHRFISYSESLNWPLSILEFLCFNKYQLKATSKHIFPPWAVVFFK